MTVSPKPQMPCNARHHLMCMADQVATPDSGLDHVDALGYSGAAFRIQTLPREVVCPSTVSPRFGYKPQKLDKRPASGIPALRLALKLGKSGQFGEYLSGTAAYDLWIKLLEADEDSEFFRQQEKAHKEDSGMAVMNYYCFLSLVHARETAGPFLKRRAAELEGDAAQLVNQAAACYERVAKQLKTVGKPVFKPVWEPENRKLQATAMRQAKALEQKADKLLGEALGKLASPQK